MVTDRGPQRWWLHKNAAEFGVADGKGRKWEQMWEDLEWCEKLPVTCPGIRVAAKARCGAHQSSERTEAYGIGTHWPLIPGSVLTEDPSIFGCTRSAKQRLGRARTATTPWRTDSTSLSHGPTMINKTTTPRKELDQPIWMKEEGKEEE
ncbi:hypothetical protein EV426DRAFT_721060 [Tirmania nivea]|nr:hypothetical protein EV426DRAFT_721060 [Tirmania nivea]